MQDTSISPTLHSCICEPIPDVMDAARYLDAAVVAHMQGNSDLARELIRAADMAVIRKWLKAIWADCSKHVQRSVITPKLADNLRHVQRMPSNAEKAQIHARDGYNCRFCGIPVIRRETRKRIHEAYPEEAYWGSKEIEQHAGFQVMWAQYDHVVPHAHGGTSDLSNVVLTCAACNFGRGAYTLEDMALLDPRSRAPVETGWDGLERFP